MTVRSLFIDRALAGQRTDQALALLVPALGLRGRRRLISDGRALLNGQPARAAQRLCEGDLLELKSEQIPSLLQATDQPRFVALQGNYCFLYKPAGMHSAALPGRQTVSLEAALPHIADQAVPEPAALRLLQRLDYRTSGLVCAALNEGAVREFRLAERAGKCEKRYAALLYGLLEYPQTVQAGLDTARRRKSRILPADADSVRWTEFFPLVHWEGRRAAELLEKLTGSLQAEKAVQPAALTLAACRIRCGARHQIRAHAASLGLPLWGDPLYGTSEKKCEHTDKFFLHHGCMRMFGASHALLPAWPLPVPAMEALRKWFEKRDE